MPVAVLFTDPARPALDPALAISLRNAWGGGAIRWLAPGEAAEFAVPEMPWNLWDVWGQVQEMGVDLCVVPEAGRRKRLLLADMDSTMIGQECIDELAEVAGVGDEVRAVTARAMNGELEFEEALAARLKLMAGLPEEAVGQVLTSRIGFAPGGAVLVATMKAGGAHAMLVSGGFTAFSGPVAAALGFDETRANRLEIEGGKLTGGVEGPVLGRAAKVEALEELCARLGIAEADALAVGDGANDLGMLGRAGMGVAAHAKPSVAAKCDLRINHGDLTALLYLQGYAKADFVAAEPGRLATG